MDSFGQLNRNISSIKPGYVYGALDTSLPVQRQEDLRKKKVK
jgi:hypothetical protein